MIDRLLNLLADLILWAGEVLGPTLYRWYAELQGEA